MASESASIKDGLKQHDDKLDQHDPNAEFGGLEARKLLEKKLLRKVDRRMLILILAYALSTDSRASHAYPSPTPRYMVRLLLCRNPRPDRRSQMNYLGAQFGVGSIPLADASVRRQKQRRRCQTAWL